jgi:hypothetical protein
MGGAASSSSDVVARSLGLAVAESGEASVGDVSYILHIVNVAGRENGSRAPRLG